MVARLLSRAVCVGAVLGSAAALGVAVVPPPAQAAGWSVRSAGLAAAAAGQPGWRIVRRIGPATSTTSLDAVTATGPADAWAVGGSCGGCTVQRLLVERWNGTAWRQARVPSAIATDVSAAAISARSARNVWIIGGSQAADAPVAVRFNGSRWTSSRLPSWVVRLDRAGETLEVPAAFGRSDVWNFSLASISNPAVAARFDGHSWHRVFLPGRPDQVSAPAANDIWAVGPSRKTMNSAHPVNFAMHWNGHSWQALRMPAVRPLTSSPLAVLALGSRNVWVMMRTGTVSHLTGLLLHWNGRSWQRVKVPSTGVSLGGTEFGRPLVPDGHGGFWFQQNGLKAPNPLFMYHYSGGKFTRQRIGSGLNMDGFAWIPRTRSVWAVGRGVNAQDTALQAIVAKDGR
ncbi:MAG TPA: hypothetical protein VGI64_01750 [Streptosporangiaceae bacterium]